MSVMKLSESCRVIYGKHNFLKFFVVGMASIAVMLAGGLIKGFVGEESFLRGLIDGFCTSFCGVMNIVAAEMLILGAFGAVRRVHPGYKYFHSISDGFGHFKHTLIFANMAGILFILLYAAVGIIFFKNIIMLSMIFAAFLITGWCDLAGSSRHKWLAIMGFLLSGFSFGFVSGLLDEETSEIFSFVNVAVICAGAVFYIICLIFGLSRAEKLWAREG